MARILLLGGLDPSGGAGITLDATVVSLHGAEPLPIAVATTVQSRHGFERWDAVASDLVRAQVAAVLRDGPVDAVKVGFVGGPDQVRLVAELLAPLRETARVIVDPVLSATAGGMDRRDDLAGAYLEHLVPGVDLITPNSPELEQLGGGGARELLREGARAVLHKGGHRDSLAAIDELWAREVAEGERPVRFSRERHGCGAVRGTGCALASAVAVHLAGGGEVEQACRRAGDWLGGVLSRVEPRPDGLPNVLPLGQGMRG